MKMLNRCLTAALAAAVLAMTTLISACSLFGPEKPKPKPLPPKKALPGAAQ